MTDGRLAYWTRLPLAKEAIELRVSGQPEGELTLKGLFNRTLNLTTSSGPLAEEGTSSVLPSSDPILDNYRVYLGVGVVILAILVGVSLFGLLTRLLLRRSSGPPQIFQN